MVVRLSTATRNAQANAITTVTDAGAGAGQLRIYTGTQPATGDTAVAGTLLATVTLIKPSFGAAANGTITMADPAAVTGAAAGTAGWFRIVDSAGNNVLDGSVTATGGGGDLQLSNTSIAVGQTVDITSGGTFTVPA